MYGRFGFQREMLLKALNVLVGHFLGEPRQYLSLHTGPRLENVLSLRKARLGNGSALVGGQVDQSLSIEARKGGSDDGSAYAKTLTYQIFCQLVAW